MKLFQDFILALKLDFLVKGKQAMFLIDQDCNFVNLFNVLMDPSCC